MFGADINFEYKFEHRYHKNTYIRMNVLHWAGFHCNLRMIKTVLQHSNSKQTKQSPTAKYSYDWNKLINMQGEITYNQTVHCLNTVAGCLINTDEYSENDKCQCLKYLFSVQKERKYRIKMNFSFTSRYGISYDIRDIISENLYQYASDNDNQLIKSLFDEPEKGKTILYSLSQNGNIEMDPRAGENEMK